MFSVSKQEKRRAERAEQQRIRTEKDKERQARREVCITDPADLGVHSFPRNKKQMFIDDSFPNNVLKMTFNTNFAFFNMWD